MKQIPIDPKRDELWHPVIEGYRRFGMCVTRIDPKTGHSDICPHGFQAVWANFSTDERETNARTTDVQGA
jgi:hypothetical protein